MYDIINEADGSVVYQSEIYPEILDAGQVVIESPILGLTGNIETDILSAIEAINAKASREIDAGYIDANGVRFSLSQTDQLNYNALATSLALGATGISVYGELGDNPYHEVALNDVDGKALLLDIMAFIEGVLSSHRAVKVLVGAAISSSEISTILSDNNIV